MAKKIFIVAANRTPIGSYLGSLSSLSAPLLGAEVIKSLLKTTGVNGKQINEVLMGNVLSAGLGQAPARQASVFAGIPYDVPCTTINKVCASGMKAVMLGASSIALGDADIVIAGGMESMSNVPHYVSGMRKGVKFGDQKMVDGLVHDGLTDVYNQYHMGNAAELCASECNINREAQDDYAITSYQRSAEAWQKGYFKNEVVPVSIPQRKGDPIVIVEDEEYKNVFFDKIKSLRPVFQKDGTVTAANASTLNDGASALLLMSEEAMEKYNLKPLARIVSYADAASAPEWFTTAPSKALPLAAKKAGINLSDLDLLEINEAFSVVSLANIKEMKLDPNKVNIHGGAVSLGHPLGCSGARILTTLVHALQVHDKNWGGAGICNGGGGASAMIIERL